MAKLLRSPKIIAGLCLSGVFGIHSGNSTHGPTFC